MIRETPSPDPVPFETDDGARLQLRRFDGGEGKPAVLLVHGSSAGSGTFRIGEQRSLAEHLCKTFDVWLLDWRGSRNTVPDLVRGDPEGTLDFSFTAGAEKDLPAALAKMRELGVEPEIRLMGHCAGGAIVCQAIAMGKVPEIRRAVVTTLGLFYQVAFDGWIKAADHILELLRGRVFHPKDTWHPTLEKAFEIWRNTPLAHPCDNARRGDDFCHRISYMFGTPYEPANIPQIHASGLAAQFGSMPLDMYIHGTQSIRRGWVGPFDRNHAKEPPADETFLSHPERFRHVRLTLITGADNRVWHRDSIDRMHEWLVNNGCKGASKHVLPGFGHQDLLWGEKAPQEVFPLIVAGLS